MADKKLSKAAARKKAIAGPQPGRAGKPGGGRPPFTTKVVPALNALIEPLGKKGPTATSLLCWTCHSAKQLATLLSKSATSLPKNKKRISERTVSGLLRTDGFTLRHNRGRKETGSRDRDKYCRYLCERIASFIQKSQPAVFVDLQRLRTGGAKNAVVGIKRLDRLSVRRLRELATRKDWISSSIDRETAGVAGRGLSKWWNTIGRRRYRDSKGILVVAALGGHPGQRRRAWRTALQEFADQKTLRVFGQELPPTTYRWREIRDRLHFLSDLGTGQSVALRKVVVGVIEGPAGNERLHVARDARPKPTSSRLKRKGSASRSSVRPPKANEWSCEILPRG